MGYPQLREQDSSSAGAQSALYTPSRTLPRYAKNLPIPGNLPINLMMLAPFSVALHILLKPGRIPPPKAGMDARYLRSTASDTGRRDVERANEQSHALQGSCQEDCC